MEYCTFLCDFLTCIWTNWLLALVISTKAVLDKNAVSGSASMTAEKVDKTAINVVGDRYAHNLRPHFHFLTVLWILRTNAWNLRRIGARSHERQSRSVYDLRVRQCEMFLLEITLSVAYSQWERKIREITYCIVGTMFDLKLTLWL